MQANIELALKTREVFKLFARRIDGDKLFIEAILRKFNIVMRQCKQNSPRALDAYNQIEEALIAHTQKFSDEVNKFETVLAKQKSFGSQRINFIAQYHQTITVSTPLSLRLIEFIDIYDKLIAVQKLLHLTGCFESEKVHYINIKRIQTLVNQMLSHIMLIPIITQLR